MSLVFHQTAAISFARRTHVLFASLCLALAFIPAAQTPAPCLSPTRLESIRVASDGRGFVLADSGKPFIPWGFNYDHDAEGRQLEDYWDDEDKLRLHLGRIRDCGANVVRLHLQVGRFLNAPDQVAPESLTRLQRVVTICEELELRIVLTGLGCYRRADVPAWYDQLDEPQRWQAQAVFWQAVAQAVAESPAIFCLDLMNEPVVPGAPRDPGDWLGPPFADRHYVQFISLDPAGRSRQEIAIAWINSLVDAIRKVNTQHLITIGLVDWSLDRPGLTSGFVPETTCQRLDFLSVHLYPESNQIDVAMETLKGFQIGKPIVIQEFFPLRCSIEEADQFVRRSQEFADGWISFHWGESLADLQASRTLPDAILAAWLERFCDTMHELAATAMAPSEPTKPRESPESPSLQEAVAILLQHLESDLEKIPDGDAGCVALLQQAIQAGETRKWEPKLANRAALVALGILLGDDSVARSLDDQLQLGDRQNRDALRARITLQGRQDLSRHFWASAGFAVTLGPAQADALGITKEWLDSAPGGSGFSFADLAADRAGIALARQATRSTADAEQFRKPIIAGLEPADLCPSVLDLPEGLTRDQLEQEWGGLASEKTRQWLDEIERRIESISLLGGTPRSP